MVLMKARKGLGLSKKTEVKTRGLAGENSLREPGQAFPVPTGIVKLGGTRMSRLSAL
jgi:hypothetical protein